MNISSYDYWAGYEISTNTITNSGWVLHAVREKQFALVMSRKCLHKKNYPESSQLLMNLLHNVVELCCHEYDVIRNKALKVYVKVSSRYGWRSNNGLLPMVKILAGNKNQVGLKLD